jgi:uncharacterized Tic20 family protein
MAYAAQSQATNPTWESLPTGRIRDTNASSSDTTYASFLHLSILTSFVVGPFAVILPVVLWLCRKNDSPFIDDHGREMLNFMISYVIWQVVLTVLVITIPLLLVLWIVGFIAVIRGGVAAGRGEYFRYPVTFRFFS